MNPAFWQDRRVFVTGHTGFKGSWLAIWLEQLGAVVTGYSLQAPTDPSLFDDARVADGVTSVIGDVCDLAALTGAVERAEPEVVIHMAAQSLVLTSLEDPLTTYRTNVLGTASILEVVRKTRGIRAVVVVTSDKCYDRHECDGGYRETDPLGGHDPYSSSKACAELVTRAYRTCFIHNAGSSPGAGVATARAGNVIGGGDWSANRLVPDLIRAFERGDAAVVRNPDSVRPWQHVLEPLDGYLTLAEALCRRPSQFDRPWNFGPPAAHAQTVRWIADRAVAAWGADARWNAGCRQQTHEAPSLRLDSSQAIKELSWRPRVTLCDALDWTIGWYRARNRGEDPRSLTLADIERYQTTLSS